MINQYPYSGTDLLENPQKYQMFPYIGFDFISQYEKARKKILEILSKKKDFDFTIDKICLKLNPKIQKINSQDLNKNKLETLNELSNILYFLEHNKIQKETLKILDLFVKKFEINKKIFIVYDLQFKEKSQDYTLLVNYALLSLACMLAYKKTRNLKYLNVGLKINDTLCSQIKKIKDGYEIFLLKKSLERELDFVFKLCEKKGIKRR